MQHLAHLLAPLPPGPNTPPPGSADYQRRMVAQARLFADRLWQEAFVLGGAYVACRQPARVVVATGWPPRGGGGPVAQGRELQFISAPTTGEDPAGE